jgi:hypothetical protein
VKALNSLLEGGTREKEDNRAVALMRGFEKKLID